MKKAVLHNKSNNIPCIYRGYLSSIDQLLQMVIALHNTSIKGILAETKRATSVNKVKLCTAHIAKFFGVSTSFVGYPKYIPPNAIVPITRLLKNKSVYYTAPASEINSLKRNLKVTSDNEIYDYSRVEDISITNGLWEKPTKENAVEIIQKRKDLFSALDLIS